MRCPGCLNHIEPTLVETWKEYRLLHCGTCDLVFADPRRNPGPEWYQDQDAYLIPSHYQGEDLLGWHHQQFIRERPLPGSRLLEIGCATGVFLHRAEQMGYEVTGIDFNPESIQKATKVYGLRNVSAESFEQFVSRQSEKRYDIIVFFEVLEHQEEPDLFMQHIRRLLAPGGVVCLSVPNRERRPHFFIEGDYPPHHFTRWSRLALTNFLRRHGLQMTKISVSPVQMHWILGNSIRLGIGRRFLTRAKHLAVAPDEKQKALNTAGALHQWKTRILRIVGTPIDTLLALCGASGFQLFIMAEQQD